MKLLLTSSGISNPTIENALKEGMPPRCLVLSEGGAPTPSQRGELADRLSIVEGAVKVAVLASSTYPRGVATALASTKPGYRVFEPEEVEEAMRFLGVRPSSEKTIRSTLAVAMRPSSPVSDDLVDGRSPLIRMLPAEPPKPRTASPSCSVKPGTC